MMNTVLLHVVNAICNANGLMKQYRSITIFAPYDDHFHVFSNEFIHFMTHKIYKTYLIPLEILKIIQCLNKSLQHMYNR